MVKRSGQVQKPEEQQVKRKRPPRPKVKMATLQNAVADGKLLATAGDKVYFERIVSKGKIAVHEGIVKSISDKGIVEIWDETIEQFYCFSLHQTIPVIKLDLPHKT